MSAPGADFVYDCLGFGAAQRVGKGDGSASCGDQLGRQFAQAAGSADDERVHPAKSLGLNVLCDKLHGRLAYGRHTHEGLQRAFDGAALDGDPQLAEALVDVGHGVVQSGAGGRFRRFEQRQVELRKHGVQARSLHADYVGAGGNLGYSGTAQERRKMREHLLCLGSRRNVGLAGTTREIGERKIKREGARGFGRGSPVRLRGVRFPDSKEDLRGQHGQALDSDFEA